MNGKQAHVQEVMSAIREILINDWDPIGVMDDPDWPRDEYDSYVGQLFNFLERCESAEFIARHLCFVEEKAMGLGAVRPSARMEVAIKLKAAVVGAAPTGSQ